MFLMYFRDFPVPNSCCLPRTSSCTYCLSCCVHFVSSALPRSCVYCLVPLLYFTVFMLLLFLSCFSRVLFTSILLLLTVSISLTIPRIAYFSCRYDFFLSLLFIAFLTPSCFSVASSYIVVLYIVIFQLPCCLFSAFLLDLVSLLSLCPIALIDIAGVFYSSWLHFYHSLPTVNYAT